MDGQESERGHRHRKKTNMDIGVGVGVGVGSGRTEGLTLERKLVVGEWSGGGGGKC